MVIYLDFDGVLHPNAVYKPLELRAPGALMMHAGALESCLVPYPEAKLVLSTNWVYVFGIDVALSHLSPSLRARAIGSTWTKPEEDEVVEPFSRMTRFQQIMSHVTRNNIKRWIAIDDLHSGYQEWPLEHKDKLVLTEQSTGLGSIEAQADLNTKLMEIQYS